MKNFKLTCVAILLCGLFSTNPAGAEGDGDGGGFDGGGFDGGQPRQLH